MASNMPGPNNIVIKETVQCTWSIKNWANFDDDESVDFPEFSPPNSLNKLQLQLNLSLLSKMTSFLLIYKGSRKELSIYYRLSLLDAYDREHHIRDHHWNYIETILPIFNLNSTNYISRNQCNKLLVNGRLIVHFKMDIFEKYSPIESFGKLAQNYETLLESGKMADFIVLIGDKEFRVHKTILAAQSEVFAAMFEHDESKELKDGRVVIEDVEVEVFELLVRYIYTGKVDALAEYAAELFVAADKYQLDHLKLICVQSLISLLTTESVCGVLLLSDMHSAEQLKSKCIEYIVKYAKGVMKTEGWTKLVKSMRTDLVAQLFEKLAIKG